MHWFRQVMIWCNVKCFRFCYFILRLIYLVFISKCILCQYTKWRFIIVVEKKKKWNKIHHTFIKFVFVSLSPCYSSLNQSFYRVRARLLLLGTCCGSPYHWFRLSLFCVASTTNKLHENANSFQGIQAPSVYLYNLYRLHHKKDT